MRFEAKGYAQRLYCFAQVAPYPFGCRAFAMLMTWRERLQVQYEKIKIACAGQAQQAGTACFMAAAAADAVGLPVPGPDPGAARRAAALHRGKTRPFAQRPAANMSRSFGPCACRGCCWRSWSARACLSRAACSRACLLNPLATPDTRAWPPVPSCGAALALLLGFGLTGLQLTATVFGIGAVGLTWLAASGKSGGRSRIVLAGIMIGSLFSALISLLKYVADPESQLRPLPIGLWAALIPRPMGRWRWGRSLLCWGVGSCWRCAGG